MSVNATAMSRAFSKWWDKRRDEGEHRAEALVGWHAGMQWVLDQAVTRLEHGLSGRADRQQADDERQMCIDELKELAAALARKA